MTFIEAIKSGFKNYVTFEGRASRSEYNYWILFNVILSFISILLDPPDYYYGDTISELQMVVLLVLFLPNISVMVRRFHDTNKSGWNYWWTLTIIGAFPVIYWLVFKQSDLNHNSYGPDPLTPTFVSSDSEKKDHKGNHDIQAQLKELKQLQDDGLISEDDYDAKKKEILGL